MWLVFTTLCIASFVYFVSLLCLEVAHITLHCTVLRQIKQVCSASSYGSWKLTLLAFAADRRAAVDVDRKAAMLAADMPHSS